MAGGAFLKLVADGGIFVVLRKGGGGEDQAEALHSNKPKSKFLNIFEHDESSLFLK
jgi:hypothetical protein